MQEQEWTISNDGERFQERYKSKEAAIAEGREAFEDGFYVANVLSYSADWFSPDGDDIVETLAERAVDNVGGEFVEDWPRATIDQVADLTARITKAVNEWAEEHDLQPTFFAVGNIEHVPPVTASGD